MDEETKEKSGLSFLIILGITLLLVAFIFLVAANVTGAAVAASLGIGCVAR